MNFPSIEATNLSGEKYQLPSEFEGEINLILVAFQQWQQSSVNTWVPLLEELESTIPEFHYYELPVIRKMNFFARAFIDGGMRAGIPDPNTRRRTITLYLDKDKFKQPLAIDSEDTIQLLLVTKEGEILWRNTGSFEPEKGTALVSALKDQLKTDNNK